MFRAWQHHDFETHITIHNINIYWNGILVKYYLFNSLTVVVAPRRHHFASM